MAAFADQLVEVFTDSNDAEEIRECMRKELETLGPEETVRQAEEARKFLSGFMYGAEDTNLVLYLAVEKAHILATEPRDRAVWST